MLPPPPRRASAPAPPAPPRWPLSAAVVTLASACGSDAAVAGQATVAGAAQGHRERSPTTAARPRRPTVPAGPTTFEVRNAGAGAVTEAE